MSIQRNNVSMLRYEYDFAKDGGAIGAIDLRADITELKAGMHVLDVVVVVEEVLTSGGAATITLGNTTDPDGYFVDFMSSMASAPGAIKTGEVNGALVWNDTRKAIVAYSPAVADDFDMKLTVAVAALTAGKISVYVKVLASEI